MQNFLSTLLFAATLVTSFPIADKASDLCASTTDPSPACQSGLVEAHIKGLPFEKIVIFGDNLSDRGNGSSDHGEAGDPPWIYGYKTWTNGLVAVEQMSDRLGLSIVYDYAWGHTDGGQNFGALISDVLVKSNSGVPSVQDQIQNFTTGPFIGEIDKSLNFVWGGNNDVVLGLAQPNEPILSPYFPMDWDNNVNFTCALAKQITDQVKTLIDHGAEHLFVPNIYPRHVAPVVQRYLTNDTGIVKTYGQLIERINTNLENDLKALEETSGMKIIYYNAFGFLQNILDNTQGFDFTMMEPGNNICDRSFIFPQPGIGSFEWCLVYDHADEYFWMEYVDPTARVHNLLAMDMARTIAMAYW